MATIDRNSRPRAEHETRDLRSAEPRGEPRTARDEPRGPAREQPRDDAAHRPARPRSDVREPRPARAGLAPQDERRPRDDRRPGLATQDERRPRDDRRGLATQDERRPRAPDERRARAGLATQDERRPRPGPDERRSRSGLATQDERRPRDERPGLPAQDERRTRERTRDEPRSGLPAQDERRTRERTRDEPRSGLPAQDERRTRERTRDEPRSGLAAQDERRPRPAHDERTGSRDEARPEIKICGVNACQAVAERRPDDVRRVYLRESLLPSFGAFLKRCAAARIAYHVVEDLELEKITQSTHHEGVCFIVRERPAVTLRELLAVEGPRCLVYLDGVQNPHNLGAIVRVCAHFGAAAVLVAGADAGVSTAMLRTAEGGGEWVDVVTVPDGPEPLQAARAAGFRLIATAARAAHDLHARRLPQRAIILLGSETHGLSPALQRIADEAVRIPGTGNLDSLNVACACAVLLGEYWRAHPRSRA